MLVIYYIILPNLKMDNDQYMYEIIKNSSETIIRYNKLVKTILIDAINTFIIKGEGIDKRMHQLLESFPNKKFILTNADKEQIKNTGIDKVPYEIFTLQRNPDKTNPVYFRTFLSKFNLNAEDVIYIDHNIEAVKSAESVGIKSYHFNHTERDLEKLESFILNS